MVQGLKEKEELRSSFIRNLTHDLRTPLIAQERALSMISDKFIELNLKEEKELAKSLEKNTSHLLRMVNLILESYQFNLKKEDLNFLFNTHRHLPAKLTSVRYEQEKMKFLCSVIYYFKERFMR